MKFSNRPSGFSFTHTHTQAHTRTHRSVDTTDIVSHVIIRDFFVNLTILHNAFSWEHLGTVLLSNFLETIFGFEFNLNRTIHRSMC